MLEWAPGRKLSRLSAAQAGVEGEGSCLSLCSPHFLGPVREQVQLPGVAGAWVMASPQECSRHCPSQQGGPSARRPGERVYLWPQPPAPTQLHADGPVPARGALRCVRIVNGALWLGTAQEGSWRLHR